jgi:hypothetical protein
MTSSCNSLLAPLADQGLAFEFVLEAFALADRNIHVWPFAAPIAGEELAEHVWIY